LFKIIYGKDITDITIICWGSNKNVCIEAGRILEEQEISINVIHFVYLLHICIVMISESSGLEPTPSEILSPKALAIRVGSPCSSGIGRTYCPF
jgi:hypothetical protein